MFYLKQPIDQRKLYVEYLQLIGSLSRLSSDSPSPYLYYRTAENMFCLAFNAENLSRSDISVDARKNAMGIGLKTFLHLNGKTFQKIAEFNAMAPSIHGSKDAIKKIHTVAELRNERLRTTKEIYGLKRMCYHCVTREIGANSIYEFHMDNINIDKIHIDKVTEKSLVFNDSLNEYTFILSKNTLTKRFICQNPLEKIEINIYENPIKLLIERIKQIPQTDNLIIPKKTLQNTWKNTIILPLYAPSSKFFLPAEKSGLNQWNASGRARHPDEIYIPIPAWIHKSFPKFFPPSNDYSFDLILPNGNRLSASTCQEGRKGLMSNPNKDLGHWLLRDVLNIPEDVLVSREHLDKSGIDSAKIIKIDHQTYKIDFMPSGSYEKFKHEYKEQ